MDTRDRYCGNCGHRNPPVAEFCAECGTFLETVVSSSLTRVKQTQFALPDYLLVAREREREERRRRMTMETGEGVGLLWVGAIAAVLAIWFGGGLGPGAAAFLLGLAAVIAGLWRLRHDTRNMARAGTATVVISSVVLGAALAQTLGFPRSQIVEFAAEAPPVAPTPKSGEAPAIAFAFDGSMPMFRGNPGRTGENVGPAPLARPLVAWKTFVGGESYASPIVAGDTVFVATKAGSVVALRLVDGDELWRVDVGDYIVRSTPAYGLDTLFVAAGYDLLAINAQNGERRWSVPLRFAGSCSPVLDGDTLYVATQEGHVSAFAARSGEELWHYRNDNLLFGSPAVSGDRVMIADESGQVTALDTSSGREVWQKDVGEEVFATPAISDGVAFVVTKEPLLIALDLESGRELWREQVGGVSSPAIVDQTLYLGGDDQSLRAIDANSGKPIWSTPLGYAIESSATVSGAALFIASGPSLNAVDRATGRSLWTHVTGGPVTSDLAVVAGMVIAASHDGYIYALEAAEGSSEGKTG